MRPPLRLHLRNLGHALVEAWRREFARVEGVDISEGDIFSTREGMLPNDAPIDVRADAVVSPANAFGYMNGGIDAVYTHQLGEQVEANVQEAIRRDFAGELPVGSALIAATGREEIPWCICAPTMRFPTEVPDSLNAYLALRAALRAVREHNDLGRPSIHTVLCPGLATGVGRLSVERCARQMRVAWERESGAKPWFPKSLREAALDEAYLLCREVDVEKGFVTRLV